MMAPVESMFRCRQTSVLVTSLAIVTTVAAAAQRRVPQAQVENKTVAVTIALKAGTDTYAYTGKASCTHAPVASIYGLRAEQWTVEQSDGPRGALLTVWHPSSGPDMFSLTLSNAGKRQSVNTVKVGAAGSLAGSGTIALAREGTGGTFTVDALAATGAKITGTIKCDTFTAATAEGGD
jgi:hypothetical protein